MVAYNLSHLTQPDAQNVSGPIQDDEALFLFALIRVMRLKRILEIGGLNGYSARNFCEAVGADGVVFTVDFEKIEPLSERHVTLQKDARNISADDFGSMPLDLVFFDCHEYDVQWKVFRTLQLSRLLTDRTVLAFHDTNLHPNQSVPWAYKVDGGWVHQDTERRLVNKFKRIGYDIFALNTLMESHNATLPVRHGVTIATKFKPFALHPSDAAIPRSIRSGKTLLRRIRSKGARMASAVIRKH